MDGSIPFKWEKPFLTNSIRVTTNDAKWFLPGIRQMEDALTTYYSRYPQFQDEWYWSSAVGKDGNSQNPSTARATKIVDNWYAESDNGKDGDKERNEICRVRAFRIDLEPVNY